MLTAEARTEIAQRLWAAEVHRAPIPPLVETHPQLDPGDAYRIQLLNVQRRDEPVVGHKVGLTSPVMQQMMGVSEPDYGHLLASMRLAESEPVPVSRYCVPRVEVEVGFLLGADLPTECTEADVLAGTEALVPAIELIDSRIADWRISLVDTIADNASSAGFALGAARTAPGDVDLRAIEATLLCNGEPVERGRSDAVLGNPATAVAWLARTVAVHGVRLRAGNVVLPGSCTRAVDVAPGDHFRADFRCGEDEFGSVELSFRS
ncbi:2-keto-4-pentenoate hydratase [Saccharopolyspora sp. NPDC000359]|uniref:2-keto-4-pentenoate hydratase n=1 Tax=Saccharopolyspora sp. NPDC000359 TaxID=3154251 RepID=UPI00332227B8